MLPNPFTIAVHHGADSKVGNLQLAVGIQGEPSSTQEVRGLITRTLDSLARAAAWGGMAGESYSPIESRMTIIVADRLIGSATYLWGFDCENVDPAVLLVIKNLIHRVHVRLGCVERLEFRSSLPGTTRQLPVSLPCDYEPHAFSVEYGMTTAQVLVDADFQRRYDTGKLTAFRDAWEAWETIAIAGGFADETYPPEKSTLSIEDDLRITSTGLSCAFDGVAIADAGFYCLVNMLQTFNHRLARVEQVTIE